MDSNRIITDVSRYVGVHLRLYSHGYGNWSEIATFIGTGKTREQVEDHYERVYLRNETFIPVFLYFTKNDHILSKRTEEGILI